jgi:hypothetical protein
MFKRLSILPTSNAGKWSLWLAVCFMLIMVLSQIPTGFNGFYPGLNPVLLVILCIVLIGTSGAAFIIGLFSLIKKEERSVLVFIGMVIALWVGLIGAAGYFLI